MSRYVFDIETDGLLDELTRVWIIRTRNLDTGEKRKWLEGDLTWQKIFDEAVLLIGHNIIDYDFPALQKVTGYTLSRKVNIHDTMLMSQVLNYRRFGNDGHSMEAWGNSLGQPKMQHDDWSQYSEEMNIRCETDVDLNLRIYEILLNEFKHVAQINPQIKHYMKAEHAVARWAALARHCGWPFDVKAANELFYKMKLELEAVRTKLQPLMGLKTVAVDKCKGEVAVKKPRWTKKGFYDAHTANWFGIDPCSGFEGEERRIIGEYCRVEFKELDLDSVDDVKIFLFRNNWVPTEWNYKKVLNEETGRHENVKTSPKITEDSLEVMHGDGKLYCDFLTTKSRYGILNTWIKNAKDGILHGDCFTIGTPSMRSRHNLIVNVPKASSTWGKEMRSLFTVKKGWSLIGCDSAGNQARGLAYYINNEDFTKTLLHGDIHTTNAKILDDVLKGMKVSWDSYLISSGIKASEKHTLEEALAVAKRERAKRILYAFLFGASGSKLWSYCFDIFDQTRGNKLKTGFTKAVPGFADLLKKLENIYGATKKYGEGYIIGLAGNRIYVDSFHKLLVYLLQACEKATCSAAVMLTMERLEAANIPYMPCIMMHDEEDFQVPDEHREQAAEIGKQAFIDGPKLFGINIMDGSAKIGRNWYEVH